MAPEAEGFPLEDDDRGGTATRERKSTLYLIFSSSDGVTFTVIGVADAMNADQARGAWLRDHKGEFPFIVACSANSFKPFRRSAREEVVYTTEEVPLNWSELLG